MKVTEIQVSVGRTFNHPYEQYSNFRPAVTLKATLDQSDDHDAMVKALQRKADELLGQHVEAILAQLQEKHDQEMAKWRAQQESDPNPGPF